MDIRHQLNIVRKGTADYRRTWQDMKTFTQARTASTADELWVLEHPPVFTLGRNGRREHVLDTGTIPLQETDRGGQVTYHGPGQLVVYTLLDLNRRNMGVRQLVDTLQDAVIDTLRDSGIEAHTRDKAPGVYVAGAKIAALGLRVTRGCSYHGIAMNVDMDLAPFGCIDPCGYPGMQVTQLADLCDETGDAADRLIRHVFNRLGYRQVDVMPDSDGQSETVRRTMAG